MRKFALLVPLMWGHTAAAQGWRCSSADGSVCQDSLLNKIQRTFAEVYFEDPIVKLDGRNDSTCVVPPGVLPHGLPVTLKKKETYNRELRIQVSNAELYLATNLATVILNVDARATITAQAPWQELKAHVPVVTDRVVFNFTPQPTAFHQGVQQIGDILSDAWQVQSIASTQFHFGAVHAIFPYCSYSEFMKYDRNSLNQFIAESVRLKFLKAIDRALQ